MELADRVKKYFAFTRKEVQAIVVTILVLGFIVGFNDGRAESTWLTWFWNLFISTLLVTLAFLVHLSVQRIAGLQAGYRVEYKVWWNGLLFSLIIVFITRGKVWILLPGGILLHMLQRLRIGKFRYGINPNPMAVIAVLGPLFNIVLALFFKLLMAVPFLATNTLLYKGMIVNIALAINTMLPVPNLDGLVAFFGNRNYYVLSYLLIISASILMLFFGVFITIVGAILISLLMLLVYNLVFESKVWKID